MNERICIKNVDCVQPPSASGGEAPANGPTTSNATTPTSTMKEKRTWFQSLTRRKKSQSQVSLADIPSTSRQVPQIQNNNNEPVQVTCARNTVTVKDANTITDVNISGRKRKDGKNVFQRLRKKMGLRFSSLRNRLDETDKSECGVAYASGTINAADEFSTHSPLHELQQCAQNITVEEETLPFTNSYKRFIAKKWLENEERPNRIMHTASSQMLR